MELSGWMKEKGTKKKAHLFRGVGPYYLEICHYWWSLTSAPCLMKYLEPVPDDYPHCKRCEKVEPKWRAR